MITKTQRDELSTMINDNDGISYNDAKNNIAAYDAWLAENGLVYEVDKEQAEALAELDRLYYLEVVGDTEADADATVVGRK